MSGMFSRSPRSSTSRRAPSPRRRSSARPSSCSRSTGRRTLSGLPISCSARTRRTSPCSDRRRDEPALPAPPQRGRPRAFEDAARCMRALAARAEAGTAPPEDVPAPTLKLDPFAHAEATEAEALTLLAVPAYRPPRRRSAAARTTPGPPRPSSARLRSSSRPRPRDLCTRATPAPSSSGCQGRTRRPPRTSASSRRPARPAPTRGVCRPGDVARGHRADRRRAARSRARPGAVVGPGGLLAELDPPRVSRRMLLAARRRGTRHARRARWRRSCTATEARPRPIPTPPRWRQSTAGRGCARGRRAPSRRSRSIRCSYISAERALRSTRCFFRSTSASRSRPAPCAPRSAGARPRASRRPCARRSPDRPSSDVATHCRRGRRRRGTA